MPLYYLWFVLYLDYCEFKLKMLLNWSSVLLLHPNSGAALLQQPDVYYDSSQTLETQSRYKFCYKKQDLSKETKGKLKQDMLRTVKNI